MILMTCYRTSTLVIASVLALIAVGCGSGDSGAPVAVNPVGSWHEAFAGSDSLDRTYGNDRKFREVEVLDNGKTIVYTGTWRMAGADQMVRTVDDVQITGDFNPHAIAEIRSAIGHHNRSTLKKPDQQTLIQADFAPKMEVHLTRVGN